MSSKRERALHGGRNLEVFVRNVSMKEINVDTLVYYIIAYVFIKQYFVGNNKHSKTYLNFKQIFKVNQSFEQGKPSKKHLKARKAIKK